MATFEEEIHAKKVERLSDYDWQMLRSEILLWDEYKCVKCGKTANQVDHIIPLAIGGTNSKRNLQSLCGDCHLKKTRKDNTYTHRIKRTRKIMETPLGF